MVRRHRKVSSTQPPSGGCVLKLYLSPETGDIGHPAAFRRLCVETGLKRKEQEAAQASRLQAAVC